MTHTREDIIQGLRDLADFLQLHPDVPAPEYNTLNVAADTKDALIRIARTASWQKDFSGEYFSLRKTFKGQLNLDIYVPRAAVCQRIIVGTETIPAQPERTVEKVEWICDGALLATSDAPANG